MQLRAMAMCSAWRDWLDLKKWPLEFLELDGWDESNTHILSWVTSTKPAVKALDFLHYTTSELLLMLQSVSRTVSCGCSGCRLYTR